MKEFKFDVDGDGIAIPVIRCETQREFNKTIASYRTDGKLSTNDPDGEVIYIIYKDGSTFYHNSADVSLNEGKYKRTGILRGVSSNPDGYEVFGDFAIDEYGNIVIDDKLIEEYGVYAGQYDVKEQTEETAPEAAETVESVEETTVSETEETVEQAAEQETEINAEVAEVEAEQTAEPETFSYEFNEIHKITVSKRNNVYVEEFFEKMGGSYVKLGEKAWGCIEDIEEYYGIKINRNVQTDTEESESESESESEPTVDSNTVETITHTGYFDTS